MSDQLDMFEADPAEVERLAEIGFNAWSGAWESVKGLTWDDLRTEPPKEKFRAVARAILADQAGIR